jgi:O-antigen ligase
MPSLDVIFAWIIAVLAGLACIGALAVVIVAEVYAIRRTIERHRRPGPAHDPTSRWWRERSALTAPERRP